MIYFILYMVGVADKLSKVLCMAGILFSAVYALHLLIYVADGKVWCGPRFKKWFVFVPMTFLLLSAVIPTGNSLLAIGGAYGIEQALKSDDGAKIKQLIFKKIDDKLSK